MRSNLKVTLHRFSNIKKKSLYSARKSIAVLNSKENLEVCMYEFWSSTQTFPQFIPFNYIKTRDNVSSLCPFILNSHLAVLTNFIYEGKIFMMKTRRGDLNCSNLGGRWEVSWQNDQNKTTTKTMIYPKNGSKKALLSSLKLSTPKDRT